MRDCFTKLATDQDCRAVVLSGAGKMFTAGEFWALEGLLVIMMFFLAAYIIYL
jgi:hypothetical protein